MLEVCLPASGHHFFEPFFERPPPCKALCFHRPYPLLHHHRFAYHQVFKRGLAIGGFWVWLGSLMPLSQSSISKGDTALNNYCETKG